MTFRHSWSQFANALSAAPHSFFLLLLHLGDEGGSRTMQQC